MEEWERSNDRLQRRRLKYPAASGEVNEKLPAPKVSVRGLAGEHSPACSGRYLVERRCYCDEHDGRGNERLVAVRSLSSNAEFGFDTNLLEDERTR